MRLNTKANQIVCLDPDSMVIQGVNRLRDSVIYNAFLSLWRRISFKGAVSEQEVRDSSVEMLQSYLTSIIESIVGSVDQCPPVMRVAFKQLHKRVEEQFAEPENEVSLEENAQMKNSFKHRQSNIMYLYGLWIWHSIVLR